MSKDLKQFYKEMWTWIQEGCPVRHLCFGRDQGLCRNLVIWTDGGRDDLIEEQDILFTKSYGNSLLPFNESWSEYCKESSRETIYRNHKRLAFIEENAK